MISRNADKLVVQMICRVAGMMQRCVPPAHDFDDMVSQLSYFMCSCSRTLQNGGCMHDLVIDAMTGRTQQVGKTSTDAAEGRNSLYKLSTPVSCR